MQKVFYQQILILIMEKRGFFQILYFINKNNEQISKTYIQQKSIQENMINFLNNFLEQPRHKVQLQKSYKFCIKRLDLQFFIPKISSQTSQSFNFESFRKWNVMKQKLNQKTSRNKLNYLSNSNSFNNKKENNFQRKSSKKEALSQNYETQSLKINQNQQKTLKCTDNKENFGLILDQSNKQNQQTIIYLQSNKLKLKIYKNKNEEKQIKCSPLHLVVNEFKCKVGLGNQLKIGRKTYQIVEIYIPKQQNILQNKKNKIKGHLLSNISNIYNHQDSKRRIQLNQKNQQIKICKYCLMTEEDTKQLYQDSKILQNIMLSPCECKGSCSNVHIQCLKTWIKSRAIKNTSMVQIYDYDKLKCEICKEYIKIKIQVPLPSKQNQNQKPLTARCHYRTQRSTKKYCQINLLEDLFQKHHNNVSSTNSVPYMILKQLVLNNDLNKKPFLIKLKFNSQQSHKKSRIKVGRDSKCCDLVIDDISISRQHCQFQYDQQLKSFFLKDLLSTYGTLVKVQEQGLDLSDLTENKKNDIMVTTNGMLVVARLSDD